MPWGLGNNIGNQYLTAACPPKLFPDSGPWICFNSCRNERPRYLCLDSQSELELPDGAMRQGTCITQDFSAEDLLVVTDERRSWAVLKLMCRHPSLFAVNARAKGAF